MRVRRRAKKPDLEPGDTGEAFFPAKESGSRTTAVKTGTAGGQARVCEPSAVEHAQRRLAEVGGDSIHDAKSSRTTAVETGTAEGQTQVCEPSVVEHERRRLAEVGGNSIQDAKSSRTTAVKTGTAEGQTLVSEPSGVEHEQRRLAEEEDKPDLPEAWVSVGIRTVNVNQLTKHLLNILEDAILQDKGGLETRRNVNLSHCRFCCLCAQSLSD